APALSADQASVADSVRLALTGDAGQRVLMAWHLGWDPAWQASGKAWIAPVLAQLLDDPYAAVRCVAERSLRRLAPALVPADYDYTLSPEQRPPVRDAVFARWLQDSRAARVGNQPGATRVRPDNPGATQEDFARLRGQRDDRAVRLRE
ncbi:MAG: hypothetical protein KGS61_19310, partial [Verrucomicrobia bacterium]|nr:hypothetical protein [Verrucomicrobiota bacterium]